MTALEMTRLCAEAMSLVVVEQLGELRLPNTQFEDSLYDPLHDDAQAMALVKKLELWVQPPRQGHLTTKPSDEWFVAHSRRDGDSKNIDLNRAIVECVAQMQHALAELEARNAR